MTLPTKPAKMTFLRVSAGLVFTTSSTITLSTGLFLDDVDIRCADDF